MGRKVLCSCGEIIKPGNALIFNCPSCGQKFALNKQVSDDIPDYDEPARTDKIPESHKEWKRGLEIESVLKRLFLPKYLRQMIDPEEEQFSMREAFIISYGVFFIIFFIQLVAPFECGLFRFVDNFHEAGSGALFFLPLFWWWVWTWIFRIVYRIFRQQMKPHIKRIHLIYFALLGAYLAKDRLQNAAYRYFAMDTVMVDYICENGKNKKDEEAIIRDINYEAYEFLNGRWGILPAIPDNAEHITVYYKALDSKDKSVRVQFHTADKQKPNTEDYYGVHIDKNYGGFYILTIW